MLGSASAAGVDPKANTDQDHLFIQANAPDAGSSDSQQQLNARIIQNYTGRKYRLGPNDVIGVAVYDSPEFSQDNVLIMPDGNINVNPFGSLNVAGMTIDDLQNDLTERLRTYLNSPLVTVKLEKTKPFNVYVSGAVLRPGSYELMTDISRNQMLSNTAPGVILQRVSPLLSNVLVATGGLRYDADLEHVKVHNKFDNSSYEVNLLDLAMTGNSDQDMYLIAGDSVEVPHLSSPYAVDENKYKAMLGASFFQKEIPVKVYGFVNRPGLIMLDAAQSANLNSAIGAAGGYLSTPNFDSAYSPSKIYISRVDGSGHMATTTVDPRKDDMTLRPNDIVYVPSKTIPKVGRAFDYVARIISPLAAIGSGANAWSLLFDPTRFNVNAGIR